MRIDPIEQHLALGVGFGPRVEGPIPFGVGCRAALDRLPGVRKHLVGNFKGLLWVEAENRLHRGELLSTQG